MSRVRADRLPSPPGPWRRHGLAVLPIAAATVGVGAGAFLGARAAGVAPEVAGVLTLFAVTAWIALAAGPAAAGSAGWLGALARAGTAVDASIVALVLVGARGGGVIGWGAAWRLYVLWLTLALFAALLTRLGRTAAGRAGWALAASALLAVAMGSVFWSGGLLEAQSGPARSNAAAAVLAPNPLSGVATLVGPAVGFRWPQQGGLIYRLRITPLGEDFVTPVLPWWTAAVLWGTAALVLGVFLAGRSAYRSTRLGA